MNEFMKNYIKQFDTELEGATESINKLKESFKSTNWTDVESMIKAANEIWQLQSRIKDAMEIQELILQLKKEA